MKIIAPATFLAALLSTTSAFAGSLTVDLDLTETAKKDSETTSITVTVGDEGSCSRVKNEGKDAYEVEVCRGHADVISFDVRTVKRQLYVSSKLAAGTRTVIGRIARGDDATEIAATVR